MIRRAQLFLMIVMAGLAGAAGSDGQPAPCELVVVVSIDGLRSDALLVDPTTLPNLTRLRRTGASTLNARTDPDFTVTLPNHVCMVTGRNVLGPSGHEWAANDIIDGCDDLQSLHEAYVAGMFDVAHDHGVRTGLFVTKPKLRVLRESWDGRRGARDQVGTDDGADKIDILGLTDGVVLIETDITSAPITDDVLAELRSPRDRRLLLVHYRFPDDVGHEHGWDLTPDSPYLRAIELVDVQIGRILAAVDAMAADRGRAAVIVTSDHGGGAPHLSHERADMWVNYIIPFIVWTSGDDDGRDLYVANASTRSDPGLGPDAGPRARPPIRNGDAANLALSMLGLPAVPGSTINLRQDLAVEDPAGRPVAAPVNVAPPSLPTSIR